MNEPPPESIEGTIVFIVGWVKLGIEIFGATLVTLGVCVAIAHLIRTLVAGNSSDFLSMEMKAEIAVQKEKAPLVPQSKEENPNQRLQNTHTLSKEP